MSQLAKLNLKAVERVVQQDPAENRRRKLVAALSEQQLVLKARLKGEVYGQPKKRWVSGADGERAQKKRCAPCSPGSGSVMQAGMCSASTAAAR